MTDEEVKKYYVDLLIAQYRNKPKAKATIELMAEIFISSQIFTKVRDAFDIDTSIGAQLDIIGKYQGITRSGYLFDGSFLVLSDDDYRKLIKVKIVLNYSEANSYEIKKLLFESFQTQILMFDYGNMRMGYFIDSSVGSNGMAQLFVQKGILPKPMGVELSSTIYSNEIDSFYGFQDYVLQDTSNRSPFNSYTSYDLNAPWLSYTDTL